MDLLILIFVILLFLFNIPFGLFTYIGLFKKYKSLLKKGRSK